MEITDAVRKLREITGDSQQAFATRLGLSIRAIVNYEKDRTPSPQALAKMARLASKYKNNELANLLWSALPPELQEYPVVQIDQEAKRTDEEWKMAIQMVPRFAGRPIADEGEWRPLLDINRPLHSCITKLTELVGELSSPTGSDAIEKLQQIIKELTMMRKLHGQKVFVAPGKVKFVSDLPKPNKKDKE